MRFARLLLRAYGRFTDTVLAFAPACGADLHLVFGPNEAGKSTTLNAVTDFLFGFEHHVAYHFLHGAQELRVGASLLTDAGTVHAMRRRGRKRTLFALDADTLAEDTRRPLAEDAVAALLAGLDRTTYRLLFGLDLDALAQGGKALIAGEGEVGQSLFQAAAGLSALKRVGEDLGKRADDLFKPRASTPVLNRALNEFVERGREIRERSVRAADWQAAEARLRAAEQTYERAVAARREALQGQARLQRIRVNLPLLAQRQASSSELGALLDAPLLPADATQRRLDAEGALRSAEQGLQAAIEELRRLAQERESIVLDAALLAEAQHIEHLDREADACLRARETLGVGLTALGAARTQRDTLLGAIAPGAAHADVPDLLPARPLVAKVRRLAKERGELTSTRDRDETQHLEALADLQVARSALEALTEPGGLAALRFALEQLNDYPQTEQRVQQEEARLQSDWADVRRKASELGAADAEALAAIAVPARAEVTGFQRAFEVIDKQRADAGADLDRLGSESAACRFELRTLEAAGEVVTKAEVDRARRHRDEGWRLVRSLHIDGSPSAQDRIAATAYGAGANLPQGFELAVRAADRAADHLHADTERATRYAGHAERMQQIEASIVRRREDLARAEDEHAALRGRWQSLCGSIRLGEMPPDVVLDWLTRREGFVALYDRLCDRDRELVALIECRERLERVLVQALSDCVLPGPGPGERAQFALQRLKHHYELLAAVQAKRDAQLSCVRECEAEAMRAAAQCERSREALQRWEGEWASALAQLRLSAGMGIDEAESRLEEFEALRGVHEECRRTERAVGEQSALVERFERGIEALGRRLGRTVSQTEPEAWVRALCAEATRARMDAQRLAHIEQARERELAKEREFRAQVRAAAEVLSALAHAAGCALDALPEAEARAARRARSEAGLAALDRTLIAQNGCALDAVLQEAAAFDIDRVTRELTELTERIAQLDDAIPLAQEAVSQARRAFETVDGSALVAQLQQDRLGLAAEIESGARRWSRARLAAQVLQRVVQQYRERHQGPLLERASTIFAALTCGSFVGLTTDYQDDRQILLGVRPDAKRVDVEGMSKGTCDQLYLALRLATIESHVASRGPLPVIVDDLLVQFDDARAAATLRQLRELAGRTQVLFFTHHEHLVQLALDEAIVSQAQVHRLSADEGVRRSVSC